MKILGMDRPSSYYPERWEPDNRISLHNWKPSPSAASVSLRLIRAATANPVRPHVSFRSISISRTPRISWL